MEWNGGVDYWSEVLLHNLSTYSCMVKLSLFTSDHCVFYGHILCSIRSLDNTAELAMTAITLL